MSRLFTGRRPSTAGHSKSTAHRGGHRARSVDTGVEGNGAASSGSVPEKPVETPKSFPTSVLEEKQVYLLLQRIEEKARVLAVACGEPAEPVFCSYRVIPDFL
jgi:hypothetical protein